MSLNQLLGRYDVRLDGKGRFRMPSGLLNQLGDWQQGTFVINRGFDPCLVLYPEPVWEKISAPYRNLNINNRKKRMLARHFIGGAAEVTLDSADRFLLPKELAEYAAIDKDMIITAFSGTIELWSPDKYQQVMEDENVDFSELAEELLGDIDFNEEDE